MCITVANPKHLSKEGKKNYYYQFTDEKTEQSMRKM